MAQGKVIIAGGKMQIRTGMVDTCDCCVVACENCQSGATPRILTATFSGVTPWPTCTRNWFEHDFGDGGGGSEIHPAKWVENPSGLTVAVLKQQSNEYPCNYEAIVPATAGRLAVYTSDPWTPCPDDCADEGMRCGTSVLQNFLIYCQNYGQSASTLVEVYMQFDIPPAFPLSQASMVWFTKYGITIPADPNPPYAPLCMEAWDEDSSIGVPAGCDGYLGYGGNISVVPGR